MSKLNFIQQKIKELDGGSFQKLFDAYLYEKYSFSNINPLGSHDGTNKVTKGTPDTYIINDDNTYTLITYGTVSGNPYKKLREDVLSCLDENKTGLQKKQIKKIICGYCSSDLAARQANELKQLVQGVELELIGIGTISYDLELKFPKLAYKFLNIPFDTRQIYSIDDFVEAHDKSKTNAPLDINFMFREKELLEIKQSIFNNYSTLIFGSSGIGKTRLVLEALRGEEFSRYTILCVKNNGEILSSDINTYISTPGDYVLFLDDANQTSNFKYILDFVHNSPIGINIKLVMTVRDYAKEKILSSTYDFSQPSLIKVEKFNNDEIKEILKNNLGIVNNLYLKRIAEISKGNARLAIIAGKIALEGKLGSIQNTIDIFKNYYGKILSDQDISKNELYSLFIISFFKAIHIDGNLLLQDFLAALSIDKNDFIESAITLDRKELVDLYEDKLVKISDQSLADYILYCILIGEKVISIINLLKIAFLKNQENTIIVINTIMNLFYSEDTYEYIKSQVLESWSAADSDSEIAYLKSFYLLDQERTLLYAKKEIAKLSQEDFSLADVDFEKRFRSHYFSNFLSEILSGFKHSGNFSSAVDLLLELSTKSLECALDACYIFCNRFLYDKNSCNHGFEEEFLLIKTISESCKGGENVNLTIILLEILKTALKAEFTKTESGDSARSIWFTTMTLPLSDDVKKLRSFIWNILADLYKNETYRIRVEKFLYYYNTGIHDKDCRTKFVQYDMGCFEREFSKYFEEITFKQAIILNKLSRGYQCLVAKPTKFLNRYKENNDFKLIDIFTSVSFSEKWKEEQEEKEKQIIKTISDFNQDDYKTLFNNCKKYEELKLNEDHLVGQGLYIVFEKLEEKPEQYIEIVKLYLQKEAPFFWHIADKIIQKLIDFVGPAETRKVIDKTKGKINSVLNSAFYCFLPSAFIANKECEELKLFIDKEFLNEYPRIIDIYSLEKYKNVNPTIFYDINRGIINFAKTTGKNDTIRQYLDNYLREDMVEKLVQIFKDNDEKLEEIYFAQLDSTVDFQNLLFEKLCERGLAFWRKFIKFLFDENIRESQLHSIFEVIWNKDDYAQYIDALIEIGIFAEENFKVYNFHDILSAIFSNSDKTSEIIISRKEKWLEDFIVKNIEDQNKIEIVFEIVANYFEKSKIGYFKLLFKLNKDFELFKQLPLFHWNYSWSGSEIPLIDERIKFLEDLKSLFIGVNFIEHKDYINKKIDCLKVRRNDAKIREYLENL